MEQRRTDLALEARELWQERAGETSQLEGVEARTCLLYTSPSPRDS